MGETYDEPDHLAWARRLLETGETERLSVLHYNSKTPGTVPNAIARQVARKTFGLRDPPRLRFWTRLPTVLELALLLGTVFVAGRRFLGEEAACLATTLCALDPNLIANSAVITVDTAYALATLLVVVSVLWLAERPSLLRGAAVGAALGLAFAVKFSAFLLLPTVVVFPWLIPSLRARLRSWRTLGAAGAGLVAMLVVIAAGYRFHDVGAELNDVGWRSPFFLRLHGLVPHLRLPVPADFATGFDLLAVAVDKDYPVVLLSRHYPRGVWFYFGVLWLLKTPLLMIAAILYGVTRAVATRAIVTRPALALCAGTLIVNLVYFSLFFAAQVGFRFVLMGLPLVALLAAAGLAPLATARRGRTLLVVVALASAAESVPYLGNHLAFTNVAVQPKREAFRLLTNANIDWGQNDEKIRGWLEGAGLGTAALDPVHALPGENVFDLNRLAGVGKFGQHRWLREHASPRAHFGHTYLWFTVSPALWERLLEEDRHLRPSPLDPALCAGAVAAGTIADGAPAVFPELSRTEGLALCLTVVGPGHVDIGLFDDEGTVAIGPGGQPLRDQPLLRPGQQSWYRVDPGPGVLTAFWATGFRGRWAVRGAPESSVSLATRTIAVEKGEVDLSPP